MLNNIQVILGVKGAVRKEFGLGGLHTKMNPCDSNLIGAIRAQTRYACMKILSEDCLCRRAIMIDTDAGREVIFLAILHSF